MNRKQTLQALMPLALAVGVVACGSQQKLSPAGPPKEAQSPAPVEAYAEPPGPVVATATPVAPEMRTSLATPSASPRRAVDPAVDASGPMTEPQRVVLSAVALCMQKAVDKGAKLGKRSVIVNVTVEPSGAVSSVALDGGNERLKSCAEPEIRKARYAKTDEQAGVRVIQYPIDASLQEASDGDEE